MHQLELLTWTPQKSEVSSVGDGATAESALALIANPLELERVGRSELNAKALEYLQAARSERTRIAYASNWRLFERWCVEHDECALPASAETLARYLAHLARDGRKTSTIRRARIAIGVLHGQRGLPRPDHDERIRTLERGIGKVHGTREIGAKPLLVPELERVVSTLGESARDARDRALLLLGFAGAFRSSDLVALDVTDLELAGSLLRVHLRRSKEDQLGRGSITEIPRAHNPALCAVAALERWMTRIAGAGPLFRAVHGSRVGSKRLRPRAVSRVLQRATERVGVLGAYSSHSLRSGLATSAHAQGHSARNIQAHGRWKDLRSLDRYIRVSSSDARSVISDLL